MKKSDTEFDKILDSEREWRRYLLQKIDNLEKDLNIFKIKAFGFIAVLAAAGEVIKNLINKH